MRGGSPPGANWAEFGELTGRMARVVFPTLTEPLLSRAELRARVGDDAAWEALVERPLGETLAHYFSDDLERGIVATDALIGTFAGIDDESLRQNRCFLYHVIGNGTGDWDVPVGGMGKLTESLASIAWAAGAELRTEVEVTRIETDGVAAEVHYDGGVVSARHVLANVAPAVLARLLGEEPERSCAGGRAAQAQPAAQAAAEAARPLDRSARGVRRDLPRQRVRDPARGRLRAGARRPRPELAPCEIYCHSLTDPSILGDELRDAGAQTLTSFGLHMPARLFAAITRRRRRRRSSRPCARSTASSASRSRTACGSRPQASRAWRRGRRSSSRPSSACPAATSSTATSPGRSPSPTPRSARGASRRRTPTS